MTLLTPEYLAVLHDMHVNKAPNWGDTGRVYIPEFMPFYKHLRCKSILDYGAGKRSIEQVMRELHPKITVDSYDPAIPEIAATPVPHDFVVCTDVLEHIEPECLDDVLAHIADLAIKGAFLCISIKLAKHILPDGRNAHLIVESRGWWLEKLMGTGRWIFDQGFQANISSKKHVRIWLRKKP